MPNDGDPSATNGRDRFRANDISVRDAGQFVGQSGGLAGARPPLLPTPSSHMQLLALQINQMQQCGHMGAINRLNLQLFLPQGAMPALGEGRAPCLGRRPIPGRMANFPYPDDRPRPRLGPSPPSARSHPRPRLHFPVHAGIRGGSRALSLGRGASLEGWPIFHIRKIGPVLVPRQAPTAMLVLSHASSSTRASAVALGPFS